MRVLVTGAAGFIGRHLVQDQLSRGREVTAVDWNGAALEALDNSSRLTVIPADYRDISRDSILAGHEVCFHLASLHLEVGVSDQEYWQVNVTGTREFVERCHRAGVNRFVHVSSVGVFGQIENPPADEDSPCHPELEYEKTKLEGERQVQQYGFETGYPIVVIRPAWVYGPDCPRTGKLVGSIRSGRFFYVGKGDTLRHPIFIEDMVEGFDLAASHAGAAGEVFIMAGPRAVTIRELVETIADLLGVARPKIRLPEPLVWLGALTSEKAFQVVGREPPFSRRSLRFFSGNTSFRIDKAKSLLGFEPTFDLSTGLSRSLTDISSSS